jgi:hypothetical protein
MYLYQYFVSQTIRPVLVAKNAVCTGGWVEKGRPVLYPFDWQMIRLVLAAKNAMYPGGWVD